MITSQIKLACSGNAECSSLADNGGNLGGKVNGSKSPPPSRSDPSKSTCIATSQNPVNLKGMGFFSDNSDNSDNLVNSDSHSPFVYKNITPEGLYKIRNEKMPNGVVMIVYNIIE